MRAVCEVKSGFFRCKEQTAGRCIYCARSFCSRHGVVQEDGQEICSRKFCVAKRDDLIVHMAYKEAVNVRNESQSCGREGCRSRMTGECVRCRGFFCDRHVEKRQERVYENQVLVHRVASLCEHCWRRRSIWLKV